MPWISLLPLFLLAAPVGAADPAVPASAGLEARLLAALAAIPYVDTHTHLPDPVKFAAQFKDKPCDPVWLLGSGTYVAEFTSGSTWDEVKANLATYANHPYYRVILEAFRDLYGLKSDEKLSDANIAAVSERMAAAHRTPGWYDEVLRKRANVAHIVWLGSDSGSPADVPAPWYHSVWNIDGLVFVSGQDTKTKEWAIDGVRKRFGAKLRTLKDMETLIGREIDGFFARGGAALKSTAAYYRTLDFDDTVPRSRAAGVFAKVANHERVPAAEQRALEDYLMTRVLTAVARNKKPIQFHTGNQQNWNTVANSTPLGLNRLLVTGKWWDVKFVVLHGGYPYTREAIMMTRYFGNCYLDLAWMVLFSPSAAHSALAEALDIVPADRLLMGSDTANLEEMYGTIKFTRRVLANVLAGKVRGGFLTEGVALSLARRVLHDNGMALYGIKE